MENRKCVILSIGVTLAICGMLCSSFWGRYSMFDNYFLLFPVSLGICLVTITAILSFLTKKKIFQLSVADVLISIWLWTSISQLENNVCYFIIDIMVCTKDSIDECYNISTHSLWWHCCYWLYVVYMGIIAALWIATI